MLTHPFVIFFAVVAVALLVLRVAGARPVPELIAERALLAGCLLGAAAFLAGNWAAAHVCSPFVEARVASRSAAKLARS